MGSADGDLVTVFDSSYRPWRAWHALTVFVILLWAEGIDIAIVTLLVHPIEATFRMHDVGFAAISAIPVALGIALVIYPAGLLADTFNRRYVIAAGALLWTIAALVASRADSGPMFFFARLLAGIGTGMPAPAMLSIISDAFPRTRRAWAISISTGGTALGLPMGFAVCGALVEATQRNGIFHMGGLLFSPWQQCLVAVAAIGVVVVLLVLTILEPPRTERVKLAHVNLRSHVGMFGEYIRRHGLLWALLILGFAASETIGSGVAAWGPAFGMRHYGIVGVAPFALMGAFRAGGALLGSIGAGFLVQRGMNRGDHRAVPHMLVAAAVISCVGASFLPFMPSWLLAVAVMGGIAMAVQTITILRLVGVQETAPNEVRGQLLGLCGITLFIPSATGASLVAFFASGVFAKTGGLGPALATVGCLTSLLAVVLFASTGGLYERARLREMRAYSK